MLKERSLCCSYRVVCFDKRFNNESAMLTSPNHGRKRKKVQFMAAKETKNNGIIKKQSKMALYGKMALYVLFENKNTFCFFTFCAFYLTYKLVKFSCLTLYIIIRCSFITVLLVSFCCFVKLLLLYFAVLLYTMYRSSSTACCVIKLVCKIIMVSLSLFLFD